MRQLLPVQPRRAMSGPPPDGAGAPDWRAEEAVHPVGRGRVLIVEDDYFVALSNEMALAESEFEVVAVASRGEEAVRLAAALRPEIVLMDIRLAGVLDGIETAILLRKEGFRCIFASAHSDEASRERGRPAEPAGWLSKPFTDGELVTAVSLGIDRIRRGRPS